MPLDTPGIAMTQSNPFHTPMRAMEEPVQSSASGLVTAMIVEQLRQTKPWLIFFAVIGFLMCALMVFGGLGVLAFGSFAAAAADESNPMAGLMPLLGAVYLVLGIIFCLPSWFLVKQSSAISNLVSGGGVPSLEATLIESKKFWLTCGIMAIAMIILYVIMFVAMFALIPRS
jgi:hypothetical protein